jgi:hypothetical protein
MSGCAPPTLTGFQAFLSGVAGIDPLYLPPDSPVVGYAFQVAQTLVNTALWAAGTYTLAVYNLGTSQVINFAPDQTGRTFFLDLRKKLGIDRFAAGVVASTSDQSTGTSLLNPEFMKNLTLANLQQIKDPFGRQYLALAQDYGPSVWGLV